MTDTPNKPAALDAVAWMNTCKADGEQHLSFCAMSDTPFNRERWIETPLTDLNKAQERIDRLEERGAKWRKALAEATALALVNYDCSQTDCPTLASIDEFRNDVDRDEYLRRATAALTTAIPRIQAQERARIVAWLQKEAGKTHECYEHVLLDAADAIEQGAHIKD